MKKVILISSLMFFLMAQPFWSHSESNDNRSAQILNKVSKTYKNYKTMKAVFTVNVSNKQSNSSVKQNGVLYVKGKKFRVDMSGQEIYCDGKTIWTFLKDANEVQITKFDEKNMDVNPSKIFTIYQKGFVHKYAGQKTIGGKSVDLIELTPSDKSKSYFKVRLAIEKVAAKIKEMVVYNKNGVTTTYNISKFSGNLNISDSFFKFNPKSKPGVIEIDLR
jgi:outer membrane lipoprotein-sorting protein